MKQTVLSLIVAASLFSSAGMAASATSYNAFNDFSTVNPGGVWSYEVETGGKASYLSLYLPNTTDGLGNEWATGHNIPFSGTVWANNVNSTIKHLTIYTPANYIGLDPEAYSFAEVIFSTPRSGLYNISGNFLGIDIAEYPHYVNIFAGSSNIYSGILSSYAEIENFSVNINLAAGEKVSFQVDTGIGPFSSSTYSNLATGLQATVSAAPEPAGWLLMIMGVGCIGAALKFSRRRSIVIT